MKKLIIFIFLLTSNILIAQMPSVDVMATVSMNEYGKGSSGEPIITNEETWTEKTHISINNKMVIIGKDSYEVVAIAKARRSTILGEYKIFYKKLEGLLDFPFSIDFFYYSPTYKELVQPIMGGDIELSDFVYSW